MTQKLAGAIYVNGKFDVEMPAQQDPTEEDRLL